MNNTLYITDFEKYNIDNSLLSYYESYFKKFYYHSFEKNKGTEIILDLMSDVGSCEKWLDLGAGSTTIFWSIPMNQVGTIECNDIAFEALKVLSDFSESDFIPKCYEDISLLYNKDKCEIKRKIGCYHIFNVFQKWPEELHSDYDLITEFGTFGQAKSEDEFIKSVHYASLHLISGGKLVGANWVRKRGYQWKYGADNDFLKTEIIEKAASENKMKIQFLDNYKIINDELYESVLIFMLIKK